MWVDEYRVWWSWPGSLFSRTIIRPPQVSTRRSRRSEGRPHRIASSLQKPLLDVKDDGWRTTLAPRWSAKFLKGISPPSATGSKPPPTLRTKPPPALPSCSPSLILLQPLVQFVWRGGGLFIGNFRDFFCKLLLNWLVKHSKLCKILLNCFVESKDLKDGIGLLKISELGWFTNHLVTIY